MTWETEINGLSRLTTSAFNGVPIKSVSLVFEKCIWSYISVWHVLP